MKSLFLALAALLAVAAPSLASDGAVYSNGYYFFPGYSTAYSRTPYTKYYWVAPCGYGCNYQAGYWQGYTAYTYYPVKLDPAADNFELEALRVFAARDKAVLKMAADEKKSAARLQLADKLGLNANIPQYAAGVFPLSSRYGSYAANQIGSIGQTQFGAFTFNSTADVYNRLDRNVAFQQGVMLNKGGQDAMREGFGHLMDVLNKDGANATALAAAALQSQGRVGTTLATGAAAATALTAAAPQGSTTTTSVTGTIPITPVVGPPAPSPDPLPPLPQLPSAKAVAGLTCMNCHSAAKQTGKFNFEAFDGLTASAEQLAKVVKYLRSADAAHRCPPGKPALSAGQVNEVLNHRAELPVKP